MPNSECKVTIFLDPDEQSFKVHCHCKRAEVSLKEWTPGALREILDGKHLNCELHKLSHFYVERSLGTDRLAHTVVWTLSPPTKGLTPPAQNAIMTHEPSDGAPTND